MADRPRNKRAEPVRLLPVAEAAARLACSDMHVYRLIAAGELQAVDISQPGSRRSKTRIRSDHVDSYIESKTRGRAARLTPAGDAA
ncbi:MAG: excisionase family DNA-binding protein [Streptosporangiaceae bacterium]